MTPVGTKSPGSFALCAHVHRASPGEHAARAKGDGSSAGTEPPAPGGAPGEGASGGAGRRPGAWPRRGSEGTLRGLGGCAGPRRTGPGALEREAQSAGLLTWCYLPLPSALRFPRPHVSRTSNAPRHTGTNFHLPAQRALFAGLHRDANSRAALMVASQADWGHGGVKGCACLGWAFETIIRPALLGRQRPIPTPHCICLNLEGGGHVVLVPGRTPPWFRGW